MKIVSLLLMLIASTVSLFSQPEMHPLQRHGYILTQEGGKVEGIVWLSSDEKVWLHQSSVKFLPAAEFAKLEKNKTKYFETYKPKDILGYGFDDVDLKSVEYADMGSVGLGSFKKRYFLKVLTDGKISVYQYFETPPAIRAGDDANKSDKEWAEDFQILVQKDEGKVKLHEGVDMLELISDCPAVKEKYISGGYGFLPSAREGKKGLAKLIAKVKDKDPLKDALPQIAKEYNQCGAGSEDS